MDVAGLVQVLESLSLVSVVLWIGAKIADTVFSRLIDEKVISELWESARRRYKIFRTKYRPIGADFEYSIGIGDKISVSESRNKIQHCVYQCESLSEGNLEVVRFDWIEDASARAKVSYISDHDMSITIELVPDHETLISKSVENTSDAALDSIGINIDFQFEFRNLKGEILNISSLADFLLRALASAFEVRSVSNSTITVASLDDSLTLDEWIRKKQFDVSLLLQSKEGKRSVEFTGARAIISSPYRGVDDTTAEYIEATLLNYYL